MSLYTLRTAAATRTGISPRDRDDPESSCSRSSRTVFWLAHLRNMPMVLGPCVT